MKLYEIHAPPRHAIVFELSGIYYITSQLSPSHPATLLSPSRRIHMPRTTPLATLSPASQNPPCACGPGTLTCPRKIHRSVAAILSRSTSANAKAMRLRDQQTTNSNPSFFSLPPSPSISSPCRGVRAAEGEAEANLCAHCTNAYLNFPCAGFRRYAIILSCVCVFVVLTPGTVRSGCRIQYPRSTSLIASPATAIRRSDRAERNRHGPMSSLYRLRRARKRASSSKSRARKCCSFDLGL